jgi:phage terminase small subunit
MPPLENARHERFAQALFNGMDATDAYAAAGYQGHAGNAHRLRTNENIRARVVELQSKVEVKAVSRVAAITRDTIVEMHLKSYDRAMQIDRIGDAIAATKEISVEKGFRQEQQTVVHVGDYQRASDDALLRVLSGALAVRTDALGLLLEQRQTIDVEPNETAPNDVAPNETEPTPDDTSS